MDQSPIGRWTARVVLALVLTLGLAVVAAGCGSSDDTSSGGGEVSKSDLDRYDQRLEALYKGTYTEPTGGPVRAERGKNVWVISIGQNVETTQRATAAMVDAGKKLGWEMTIFDGKFDPTRQLQGVEQALADGADGIVALYIDCPTIKTGLQRAKRRDVPTVVIEGQDCDPPMYTHSLLYAGNQSYGEWVKGWGAAQAAWVIAKTRGKARAVLNEETDVEAQRLAAAGQIAEFKKCPTCEIVANAQFVGTDYGPRLQQKIEQAFVQHPDANSFLAAIDGSLTSGGAQAIKSTGRLDEIAIMGGEGSANGIKLIRNNAGMDACVGLDNGQEGYGAMDSLVRLFAGQDPSKANSGIGWQVCDAEHNMPPKGKAYEPPVDYVATYERYWGVE